MPLNSEEIKAVYVLQSRNVRQLGKARRQLLRSLNRDLVRGDEASLGVNTRLFALLYSVWSEAQFVQILHTPAALSGAEIDGVKVDKKKNGIGAGWRTLAALAFKRVGDESKNASIQGRLEFVLDVIDENVIKPAVLRNKIAHGQWVVALNRANEGENVELTKELSRLDYVRVDLFFQAHERLATIFRDLVQSPARGHYRDFWTHHEELKGLVARAKTWTVESKREALKKRPPRDRPSKQRPSQ